MKTFSRAVDRYCRNHPGFGIPRLILYITVASGAAALISAILTPAAANSLFRIIMFDAGRIMRGEVWRLVTWILIPLNMGSSLNGLFFTAVALYFYYYIGTALEREWGSGKFTIYYAFGMLLHIVFSFIAYYAAGAFIIIIPTYLNLSMFFAFAVLFPDNAVRLFFVIPVKMKWLGLINAGFFMISFISQMIAGSYLAALLPLVALLNFVLICGEDLVNAFRPFMRRAAYNASPNVINFKKQAKQARQNTGGKAFRHQCAVCGRTDADSPGLQFRYCSQCNGYHCFCEDHINNHIHIV